MTPSALCPACDWTSGSAPATASGAICPRCGAALRDERTERLRLLSLIKARHHLRPAPREQPPASQREPELEPLLLAGKRIQAIKRHRQLTGAGLKEAKEHVEALEARLRARGLPFAPAAREPSAPGNVLAWLFAAFVLSALVAAWLWSR